MTTFYAIRHPTDGWFNERKTANVPQLFERSEMARLSANANGLWMASDAWQVVPVSLE